MAISRRLRLAALVGAALLAAPTVGAQDVEMPGPSDGAQVPRGFVLTPSLSVLGFVDDNVFVTARVPQQSAGGRLTAGLAATVPAGRNMALNASYSISSDRFAEFRQLDDVIAAQSASLGIAYQVGRRSSVSVLAGYSMSRRPQDILPEVGVAFVRGPTERYSGGFQAQRQIGKGGQIGLTYTYGVFVYTTLRTLEERPSENWAGTWTRKIGRQTSLSASGGVQNIEGTFTPTYSFSIARTGRSTSLSLAYSRGHYPVPTLDESADSESLSAGIGFQLGRNFSLSVSPRVSQTSDALRLVRSAGVGATASYALGRWVSLRASYQGWYQRVESSLERGRPARPDLQQNVVYFGVAFSRPFRLR